MAIAIATAIVVVVARVVLPTHLFMQQPCD